MRQTSIAAPFGTEIRNKNKRERRREVRRGIKEEERKRRKY